MGGVGCVTGGATGSITAGATGRGVVAGIGEAAGDIFASLASLGAGTRRRREDVVGRVSAEG